MLDTSAITCTVNEPGMMNRLLDMKVDGLITQRPTLTLLELRSCHRVRPQPAAAGVPVQSMRMPVAGRASRQKARSRAMRSPICAVVPGSTGMPESYSAAASSGDAVAARRASASASTAATGVPRGM